MSEIMNGQTKSKGEEYVTSASNAPTRTKASNQSSRLKYILVTVNCFLVVTLHIIASYNLSVAIIPLSAVHKWSLQQRSFILSSYYIGSAISQIPAGVLSDKIGGDLMLTVAVAIWALINAITPLIARSIPSMVVARIVMGAGQGITFPSVHNFIAVQVPLDEGRDAVMSITYSGLAVGAITGLLFVDRLIQAIGVSNMFYTCAGIAASWIILFRLTLISSAFRGNASNELVVSNASCDEEKGESTLENINSETTGPNKIEVNGSDSEMSCVSETIVSFEKDPPDEQKREFPSVKTLFTNSAFIAVLIGNSCYSVVVYEMMSWMPSFFNLRFGQSQTSSASLSAVPWVAHLAFSYLGMFVANRLKRRNISLTKNRKIIQCIAFGVPAVSSIGLMLSKNLYMALVFLSLALGLLAFSNSSLHPNHQDISPRFSGTMMGISACVSGVSATAFVALTGVIVDATNGQWNIIFGCFITMFTVATIVFTKFADSEEQF